MSAAIAGLFVLVIASTPDEVCIVPITSTSTSTVFYTLTNHEMRRLKSLRANLQAGLEHCIVDISKARAERDMRAERIVLLESEVARLVSRLSDSSAPIPAEPHGSAPWWFVPALIGTALLSVGAGVALCLGLGCGG